MTPQQRYQQQIDFGHIQADRMQSLAISHLERLYNELVAREQKSTHFLHRIQSHFSTKSPSVIKGVYLWGDVGIGKTAMMDSFFACLPFEKKMRLHFHAFMAQVQDDLQRLQGTQDPLKSIAKLWSEKASILCFDEFIVKDIADAMILGGLLAALFEQGVTLVATSNIAPEQLYANGLQRQQFLGAIKLLIENTQVVHMDSHQDYRLLHFSKTGMYFHPLTEVACVKLRELFHRLAGSAGEAGSTIMIEERPISTVRFSSQVVWFEFSILCHTPRSQRDYLIIAQRFTAVLLSNVPKILPHEDNTIRYFINLVDILYEAKIILIISAAVSLEEIYTSGRLASEFERTLSRLKEMQTPEYVSSVRSDPL
jgi:cell division protein ZapE